jgi:hypothetical protein
MANPLDMMAYRQLTGLPDEEEENPQVLPNQVPTMQMQDGFNPEQLAKQEIAGAMDPEVQKARELRDQRISDAGINQGITDLGVALAAQGRVKPDNSVYETIKRSAEQNVADAEKNSQGRTKLISDFIKAQTSKENKLATEKRISEGKAETKTYRDKMFELAKQRLDAHQKDQDAAINRTAGLMVSRVNNDPIIKPSEQNLASLMKSRAILNNTKVPLTPQLLADAENDIASALNLKGSGQVTEGKIHRTELQTIGRKIAEGIQKWGNQPDIDLRKTDPALVEQIAKMNNALAEDYVTTIQDRKNSVLDEYQAAYGDDPRFSQRVDNLRGTFKKHSQSSKEGLLNEKDKQALEWANANPKDPRAAEIKQRLGM